MAEAVFTQGGEGQYVGSGSERHVGLRGHSWRPSLKRMVLVHGGYGQTAAGNLPPDTVAQEIVRRGGAQMFFDCVDGKTFGNDTAITRVGQAWTYGRAAFGTKSDKLCLYGSSMGGLPLLNWALANLPSVACVALVIGATDLRDMHDNGRGASIGIDLTAAIETAFGGLAGYNAAATAHNPAEHASSFAGIPIRIWYSGNDPVVVPSTVTSFVAGVGASASAVNMGNLGHAVDSAFAKDVAAFMGQYA